jgi:hypothetical protein
MQQICIDRFFPIWSNPIPSTSSAMPRDRYEAALAALWRVAGRRDRPRRPGGQYLRGRRTACCQAAQGGRSPSSRVECAKPVAARASAAAGELAGSAHAAALPEHHRERPEGGTDIWAGIARRSGLWHSRDAGARRSTPRQPGNRQHLNGPVALRSSATSRTRATSAAFVLASPALTPCGRPLKRC